MNIDREHILGLVLAVLTVAVLTVVTMQHRGGAAVTQLEARIDTIHDTINVVKERLRVDTILGRAAQAKSDSAIASSDSAIATVEAVADTSTAVPTSLVLPAIQTCKAAQDALLEQLAVKTVENRDLSKDLSLETQRGDLAEQAAKKEHHRLGFKSGVATGVSLFALILHFAR